MTITPFSITTGANDDYITRYQPPGSSYPVSTANSSLLRDPANTLMEMTRTKNNPTGSAYFSVSVTVLKWDTSSLPDDANITNAKLTIYCYTKTNADNLSVTADWFVFDGTNNDWTATPGTNAHSGTPISSIAVGADNDFDLSNLNNISKNGTTGLRLHVSQRTSDAAPTGTNQILFASYDNTTLAEPRLIVTHTPPTLGGGDLVGSTGI